MGKEGGELLSCLVSEDLLGLVNEFVVNFVGGQKILNVYPQRRDTTSHFMCRSGSPLPFFMFFAFIPSP